MEGAGDAEVEEEEGSGEAEEDEEEGGKEDHDGNLEKQREEFTLWLRRRWWVGKRVAARGGGILKGHLGWLCGGG